jgi:hypothetical protein
MCCREVIEGMNTRTMELDEFTTLIGEISPYYVTRSCQGRQAWLDCGDAIDRQTVPE